MTTALAIDSSSRGGVVAVARDGQVLGQSAHDATQGYAESLLPIVEDVLAGAQLGLDRIDVVAVVEGPGSFTGLRIGMMMAKALAFARDLPIVTAGSLQLVAQVAQAEGSPPQGVALEAGRGALYVGRVEGGGLRDERRVALAELPAWWNHLPAPQRVAVCASSVADELVPRAARTHVSPQALAPALASGSSSGAPWVRATSPEALVPRYLVVSQAERRHGVDVTDQVHRPKPPEEPG